jgi:BolA protein
MKKKKKILTIVEEGRLTMERRIVEKLTRAFAPRLLNVSNVSMKHADHYHGNGESHFEVRIQADALDGLAPLARHREVLQVLRDELSEIHMFSIRK